MRIWFDWSSMFGVLVFWCFGVLVFRCFGVWCFRVWCLASYLLLLFCCLFLFGVWCLVFCVSCLVPSFAMYLLCGVELFPSVRHLLCGI